VAAWCKKQIKTAADTACEMNGKGDTLQEVSPVGYLKMKFHLAKAVCHKGYTAFAISCMVL